MMQRGSDRLSVHKDDEMKHELQGLLRSGHSTRSEEWHDPEPSADDDPAVRTVAGDTGDGQSVRFELARHLGRGPFPAKRGTLIKTLSDKHAPDPLIDLARGLPEDGARYRTVQEVVTALGFKAG